MLNRKIAQYMCEVRGFRIGPFISSFGTKFPFDFDFRRLFGHKKALKDIGVELGKKIKKYKIDLIAGGETAGIPIATSSAIALNLPMVYIRKKPKGHGVPRQIEGIFKKGQRVALVDDTLFSSRQKKLFCDILKKQGLKVVCIATLAGSKEKSYLWMKKQGISLHYLCERRDLMDYMAGQGAITGSVWKIAQEFFGSNWKKWLALSSNWKRIEELKKLKENRDLID